MNAQIPTSVVSDEHYSSSIRKAYPIIGDRTKRVNMLRLTQSHHNGKDRKAAVQQIQWSTQLVFAGLIINFAKSNGNN